MGVAANNHMRRARQSLKRLTFGLLASSQTEKMLVLCL